MRSIVGVGVARDQRAWDSRCGFNRTRYEIAASPHPAALSRVDPPHQGEGGEQPPSRGLEVSLVLTPGRAAKARTEIARYVE